MRRNILGRSVGVVTMLAALLLGLDRSPVLGQEEAGSKDDIKARSEQLSQALQHAPDEVQERVTSNAVFTGRIWWIFSDANGLFFTFGIVDEKQSPPVYKAYGVDLSRNPAPEMMKIIFLAFEKDLQIQVQAPVDQFYLSGVSLYK